MSETQYIRTRTKSGKEEMIALPTGGVAPHNQAWSTITDTPTTLVGYGITDGGGGGMVYPGAGIPYSSGVAWGSSYSTSGSGTVLALTDSPTFTGTVTTLDLETKTTGDVYNKIISTDYNKAGIIFQRGVVNDAYRDYKLYNDGGLLSLSSYTNGSETDHIIINGATGFFGVGIEPDYLFHVQSSINGDWAARVNNTSASGLGFIAMTSSTDVAQASFAAYSNGAYSVWVGGNGCSGFGFTNPLAKVAINGGLNVGGNTDPGDNNLWINGIAQEPNFISGWQGNNWQIQADGDAEFNNVLIRGGLSVYELIINQLHYQNGGLIIGSGAGKIDTIVSGTAGSEVLTFHDPEGNDMVPFTAGAIVMCQRVDINRTDVVKKIVRRVASISGMEVTLATTTGWTTGDDTGVFETGDEVCAIGHLTNDSLDSCIYMSATDADNPFLRVLDGVNSYSKFSLGDKTTVKLQIGNLLSLASYDFLPSSPGYGLYCDNAYLNGRIVLPNAGMTNEGSSDSDIRIYAGSAYDDMATAPFRVTQNGSLTATGIAELGTATATVDGKASNVAIRGCDIWENAYNGDNSSLLINRIGYNGGTTKYRDFAVYNGKGSKLITVGGGTMNYVSFGNINYDDLEISLYGTCQNVWAKQLIYAYGGVSNNVLISWDTPASTTNTSYTKLKTFTLGAYLKPNRTLRLKFDLKTTSNTSYATIYRNGSPVGTERITSSVSYVTYSEDISGWNPSDAIELYVKSSDAGNTASVQNFRICGDMITSIATELQATAS